MNDSDQWQSHHGQYRNEKEKNKRKQHNNKTKQNQTKQRSKTIQAHRHTDTQTHRHTDTDTHRHTDKSVLDACQNNWLLFIGDGQMLYDIVLNELKEDLNRDYCVCVASPHEHVSEGPPDQRRSILELAHSLSSSLGSGIGFPGKTRPISPQIGALPLPLSWH